MRIGGNTGRRDPAGGHDVAGNGDAVEANAQPATGGGTDTPLADLSADAFVSYSRKDAAFVRLFVDALVARDKEVWVDWEDIPPSVDWFEQIAAGIDRADNVVCVLSPDWLASDVCRRELDHAAAANKRILPLLARAVDAASVPAAAARINWIACLEPGRLDAAVDTLVEQMDTDLPHVRGHTRWGQAALDWDRGGRDDGYLLRGTELTEAESWLTTVPGKEPAPTELQSELIIGSRRAATRRQRRLFAGVSVALVVSVLLSIFALIKRSEAIDQRNTALSRELGAQAQRSYDTDPELSVLLAREGVRAKRGAASEEVLRTALVRSRVRARHDLGAPVESVEISPDGDLYLVTTQDERGYVYELDSSRRLASFATHTLGGDAVWDARSRRVAVGGNDGVVRVYAARTGATLALLRTGHDVAVSVRFSPDGRLLAVGVSDTSGEGVATRQVGGIVQVWDVGAKRTVATLTGHPRGVNAVAWSGDGATLLSGGPDPRVRVWDTATWRLRGTLPHAADDTIADIETPAANSSLALTTATVRGDLGALRLDQLSPERVGVRLWNVRTGRLVKAFERSIGQAAINVLGTAVAYSGPGRVITLQDLEGRGRQLQLVGHSGPITSLRFKALGLVSGSSDGTVRLWAGESDFALVATLAGHDGEVEGADMNVAGRRVVSGGVDGSVRSWSAESELPVATHFGTSQPGAGFSPVLSPDGRLVASHGDVGVVVVWNAANGRVVRRLDAAAGPVRAARYSADGARLVTWHAGAGAAQGAEADVWDARTFARVARVRPGGAIAVLHVGADRLVTVGEDGVATVWSLDGRRIAAVRTRHGKLNDAVLSDDGRVLATASADRTAQLWAMPSAKLLHELRGHGRPVNIFEAEPVPALGLRPHQFGVVSADFDASGRRVATAGADGTARVWDVASGRLERVMRGHMQIVGSVEFSPDGARLLTGSPDGTARIWRVASGAQLRSVDHLPPVRRFLAATLAAWTSDGRYVVTDGLGSQSVSIWDADSGLRLVQAFGERGSVRAGGHELVTSIFNRTEVYRCETCVGVDGLLRAAASRTTRKLSKEERVRYLHEAP